jgi:predicted nucleic acid-binding protein
MLKIFLDTNILVNLSMKGGEKYKESIFGLITSEFPRTRNLWISDLVFNETHAFLTNKTSIDQSNAFMSKLLEVSLDIPFQFLRSFHNQQNYAKAFQLAGNKNYIDENKGLSMVDALLLLQMSDENGVIYSSDKRMSFYCNEESRLVARWVNF